ncbi:hypothetical protein PoB_007604300 [Plakobranchus ocellatus]|uniref:Uncharacterized protein n=1 Tax=Plakobranchus ocellatus TaxID=259542 RepID=A0AAV4DZL6_9GAST|nr:hypothetical protein PoB_007604300 [Plakobranchus ocellatus]
MLSYQWKRSFFLFKQSSLHPYILVFPDPILLIEDDQLVTIDSTVPLHCRHSQWSSCRLRQGSSSGRRCAHHHRHVRTLMASRSFHVSNDYITDGIKDAQHLHFNAVLSKLINRQLSSVS